MARILHSRYQKEDLLGLTERLNRDYYEVIDELCKPAATHASAIQELPETENNANTTLYINLCIKLIEEIRFQIRMRRQIVIPYLHQLLRKLNNKSPCENGFVHNSLIADTVKEAHDKIREILSRLQQLAKPLYLDIAQPLPYKILRNEIMIIETALTELFYLEETILLPRAMEVQDRINNNN
jgi:hypothetical protein